MRLIRATEYRRMRWKNGGGETAEIAISPAGAALDQFDWRISMARIESAGPFSAFPGVDRTLTVLDGAGLRLAVDGAPAIELTPRSAPFSFAGDGASEGTLIGGHVTDLNVMTRRDRLWHRVRRCAITGTRSVESKAPTVLIFCVAGSVQVGGDTAQLAALDTLLVEQHPLSIELVSDPHAEVVFIEISRR